MTCCGVNIERPGGVYFDTLWIKNGCKMYELMKTSTAKTSWTTKLTLEIKAFF